MSTTDLPPPPQRQPQPARGTPLAPVVAPHASEASRLLCMGTYLDAEYRDRVIEELYLRRERVVAPSLGFDAARVLAHALRAQRTELAWSAVMVVLLVTGAAATGGWLLLLVVPGLLLTFGRRVRGGADDPPVRRRLPSFWLRWLGRVLLAYMLVTTIAVAVGAGGKGGGASLPVVGERGPDWLGFLTRVIGPGSVGRGAAWLALVVLLAVGACVAGEQVGLIRVLRGELSPRRFQDAAGDPAEGSAGPRFRQLGARIRLEQHAPLIMYHEARPFCGAGSAHDTWVLAVELRPDGTGRRQPIGNRTVLAAIRPFLEQLRDVAESAARTGSVVRDRLRQLEIDECVFLPVEGLLRREDAPYDRASFEQHRARAVEEGGEKRRHFLRIRVGGWEEDLVVTVFVRVHTQGRMLMLELAPHVLFPVREDFKDADHAAYRYANNNALGKTAYILTHVPGAPGQALITLGRRLVRGWRRLTGGYAAELPEGPAVSVRELAAEPDRSTFQSMDVDRYLKSVQDRIAYGVKAALAQAGYQTGEFAQKVVNISNGGINIDSVDGSTFAIGDRARATTTSGAPTPPQRSSDHDDQ
ncbi:hypothetical protein [Streptomyces murinus]|uniref:Uncharacterized protein n=1 Tax=Streptomyces murinus TaxID=33900 RepID=A0A7W3NNH4_STRMR|nr:hypothetical protein [Streptomyces murinus]MBA9053800.1 hypothetical protein [Streptomyces murinus]UWW94888.1 hypothetical protein GO605_31650 [Streptomyces murinus]